MYSQLSRYLKDYKKRPPVNNFSLSSPLSAAVLVLLYDDNGKDCLILTKRSETVAHHKGQICFPGGVHDRADESLWHTAIRETEEETGISSKTIRFLGELGQIVTPSGFEITPFVGCLNHAPRYAPNEAEISEIFSPPVSAFLDPDNFRFEVRHYNDLEYRDPVFSFKNHQIWGATGRIIVEFLEIWKSAM